MSAESTLGERIAEAREACGLSTAQAARRMAIKTATLRNWEYGTTAPRPNKLQMLAGVLGVPLLWLVQGSEKHDPIIDRPSRMELLQRKIDRLSRLQKTVSRLSVEIADEVELMRRIEEEIEELAA